MAAPVVVATATTSSGSGTASSLTFTVPAGVEAGDVGFLAVTQNSTNVWSAPSGWTADSTAPTLSPSTGMGSALFRRTFDGSEDGTSVVVSAGGTGRLAGVMVVVRGGAVSTPVTSTDGTDDTAITVPAVTPAAADALLLALGGLRYASLSPVGFTPPVGWTEHADVATSMTTTGVQIGGFVVSRQLSGGAGVAQGPADGTLAQPGWDAVWVFAVAPIAAIAGAQTVPAVVQSGTLVSGSDGVTYQLLNTATYQDLHGWDYVFYNGPAGPGGLTGTSTVPALVGVGTFGAVAATAGGSIVPAVTQSGTLAARAPVAAASTVPAVAQTAVLAPAAAFAGVVLLPAAAQAGSIGSGVGPLVLVDHGFQAGPPTVRGPVAVSTTIREPVAVGAPQLGWDAGPPSQRWAAGPPTIDR